MILSNMSISYKFFSTFLKNVEALCVMFAELCPPSEYSLHVDRMRGRFSVTFINQEDLVVAKFEGWPDIKARCSLLLA